MHIYKQKFYKWLQQLDSAEWEFSTLWGLRATSQAQGTLDALKNTEALGPGLKFC